MATLDFTRAAFGVDTTEPGFIDFAAGLGAGTATSLSFRTVAGNRVQVTGTGLTFDAAGRPTGGTATAIEIDVDNNGSVDLVISGINAPAASLDDGAGGFWRFLDGNDVILGPDSAQGAANGIFRIFGDGLAARNGATGGNDYIQLGDRIGATMGDVYTVGATSAVDYKGGADEMLGLLTNAVQYAHGDAGLVYGGSKLTGGNDTILIQSTSTDSYATGDAVRAWSLNGKLATVVGGNDTMTAGLYFKGSLAGDVHLMEASARVEGGDDRLTGGGFGEILAGDVHTALATATGAARVIGGDDAIYGNGGADIIAGDLYRAASLGVTITGGNDTIDGGAGDDILSGDVYSAYPGLQAISGGADVIRGGAGNDRIYGDSTDNNQNAVGIGGSDRLYGDDGNDQLFGHGGDDTLDGGTGTDTLWGGDGNDWLSGGSDADRMSGDAGDDLMDGGAGADSMSGGTGNDTYYVNDAGDLVNEAAGAGVDAVWSVMNAYRLTANVETLSFNGTGNFTGIGNALANTIAGSAGADTLDGGDGNDVLIGGAGADRLVGGAGTDTASYATASGRVWAILTGSPSSQGGEAAGDTYVGVENLAGSAFDDVLQGDGLANALSGADGNDQLMGAAGGDVLAGGNGNDQLSGGDGTDVLRGGAGADILYGGLDADVFDFDTAADTSAAARDVIRSLNTNVLAFEGAGVAGGDVLDLSGIDANTGAAGNQAFAFGGTGTGRVSVVSLGADSLVRANTDSDAAFEVEILIEDGGVAASAYKAGDFIL
ncbi:MAG: calcium-binding protein [Amaricoccus sp.]